MTVVHIYNSPMGGVYVIPAEVVKATRFRKCGMLDARFKNTKFHDWFASVEPPWW